VPGNLTTAPRVAMRAMNKPNRLLNKPMFLTPRPAAAHGGHRDRHDTNAPKDAFNACFFLGMPGRSIVESPQTRSTR